MRIRTTVLAALTAGLLLSGCSSAEPEADTKPTTAAPSETPAADTAAAYEECVAAIADDPDAETPPAACDQLPDGEIADATLDGIQRANEAARDALGDAIAEASEVAGN